jgi:hypothetical protein
MAKHPPRDTSEHKTTVRDFRDLDKTLVAPMVLPAPPRRKVPEPPRSSRAPALPPPPRPSPADVIPITRARTTPPKSFHASSSGWDLPKQPPAPHSRNAAGAHRAVSRDATIVERIPPEFLSAPAVSGSSALAAQPELREPTPAPAPPVLVTPQNQWAVFEQLGLGPPKKQTQQQNMQKTLVSAYRLLGFAVLTLIVAVLVGYIATSAFYFVSDSWIQPMKVSRTDERVLALESQLVEQQNIRDRIVADLAHADRYIAVQQAYQGEFAAAIRADLSGRQRSLDRTRALAKEYEGARHRIQKSNRAYASASQKKMAQEYAAGLIDRSDMLAGKFQVAQITSSNLSLAERQAEYEERAAELAAEAEALDAILSENGGESALSYDVLKIKQEYELSRLETTKAIEGRVALQSALERQDAVIAGLEQSPWLRAIADDANVAFVPYENLDNVSVGVGVYGCALEMIWCDRVGKVIEVMPGEVTFKHPHREKILRGQMVVIDLEDGSAAEDDVLFVGGAPLLL